MKREVLTIPSHEIEIGGRTFVLREMSGRDRDRLQVIQQGAAQELMLAVSGAARRDPGACIEAVRQALDEAEAELQIERVRAAIETYDRQITTEAEMQAAARRAGQKADEILKWILVDTEGRGVDDAWLDEHLVLSMRKRICAIQRELNLDDEVTDTLGKVMALLPG